MTALPPWDDLIAGKDCPFCAARPDVDDYAFKVADLSVSTLFLDRNQMHRGYCLLVFNARHVTGIEHLTPQEHAAYMQDFKRAADAVYAAMAPAHMNYATLGNVIPHLHMHIIPRYPDDGRWGAPVWTTRLEDMKNLHLPTEEHYLKLVDAIRRKLREI